MAQVHVLVLYSTPNTVPTWEAGKLLSGSEQGASLIAQFLGYLKKLLVKFLQHVQIFLSNCITYIIQVLYDYILRKSSSLEHHKQHVLCYLIK